MSIENKKKFSLALQANWFYIVSHEYLEQNEIIGFHLFNCTPSLHIRKRGNWTYSTALA